MVQQDTNLHGDLMAMCWEMRILLAVTTLLLVLTAQQIITLQCVPLKMKNFLATMVLVSKLNQLVSNYQ